MLATDPTQSFPVVLKAYRGQADAPTLFCRYLSGKECRRIMQALDNLSTDGLEALESLFELVREVVVAGSNLGRDFVPEEIDELLTINEANELLKAAMLGQSPTLDDKKKSDSP